MPNPISWRSYAACCALLGCTLPSMTGCSSSTTDSGKLVVDLRTGETQRIGQGEPVPVGYSECPNDVCPELALCDELTESECLVRNDCFPVYSENAVCSPDLDCPSAMVECRPVGDAPPLPGDGMCDPSACPEEVPAIARICEDGSTAPLECLPNEDGQCSWHHVCGEDDQPPELPPEGGLCPAEQCPEVAPAIGRVCEDGSSAESVCRYEANGECGWNLECDEDVEPSPGTECVVGGCSGELCTDAEGGAVASPCIWRDEFACYQDHGVCEVQASGSCGWTPTPELDACLENPPQP